jgi:hypothetical protein
LTCRHRCSRAASAAHPGRIRCGPRGGSGHLRGTANPHERKPCGARPSPCPSFGVAGPTCGRRRRMWLATHGAGPTGAAWRVSARHGGFEAGHRERFRGAGIDERDRLCERVASGHDGTTLRLRSDRSRAPCPRTRTAGRAFGRGCASVRETPERRRDAHGPSNGREQSSSPLGSTPRGPRAAAREGRGGHLPGRC